MLMWRGCSRRCATWHVCHIVADHRLDGRCWNRTATGTQMNDGCSRWRLIHIQCITIFTIQRIVVVVLIIGRCGSHCSHCNRRHHRWRRWRQWRRFRVAIVNDEGLRFGLTGICSWLWTRILISGNIWFVHVIAVRWMCTRYRWTGCCGCGCGSSSYITTYHFCVTVVIIGIHVIIVVGNVLDIRCTR